VASIAAAIEKRGDNDTHPSGTVSRVSCLLRHGQRLRGLTALTLFGFGFVRVVCVLRWWCVRAFVHTGVRSLSFARTLVSIPRANPGIVLKRAGCVVVRNTAQISAFTKETRTVRAGAALKQWRVHVQASSSTKTGWGKKAAFVPCAFRA